MLKKLLFGLCTVWVCQFTSLYAQTAVTLIPDENFEQELINLGYDDVLDGEVLTSNINTITSINITYSDIDDLTGIEDFTALQTLNVTSNNLTSIDLTPLTNLVYANLYYNDLTTIDISNLTNLQTLYVHYNNLSSIDVSTNTGLTKINVANNDLSTIDVSNNTILDNLNIANNDVTEIDISNNTSLVNLDISYNSFSTFDLSSESITWLKMEGIAFSTIDLSNLPNLINLDCDFTAITSLDLSNLSDLLYLYCSNTNLTSLDISNNLNLKWLYCYNNDNLSELTLNAAESFIKLNCSNNSLTELDLSGYENLQSVDCSDNNLTSVSFSESNNSLVTFKCKNNALTSLNFSVGDFSLISTISAENNNLTQVNLWEVPLGNFINFNFTNNDDLSCVLLDEAGISSSNSNSIYLDDSSELSSECTFLSTPSFDANAIAVVNPVEDWLIFQIPNTIEVKNIKVYTISGQEVVNSKATSINFSAMASGMYVAHIDTNQGTYLKKIIK